MKALYIYTTLLIAVCVVWNSHAQQEPQYTQFFYNKLAFNPGFAGSQYGPCFSLLYRRQWLGLEGAPESQVLNFHTPIAKNRIGLGMTINRYTIGISESLTLNSSYAYRFLLGEGTLSLGVNAALRWLTNDYSQAQTIQAITEDDLISGASEGKLLANFGAGVYYRANSYYWGVSVPRILQNNLDFDEPVTIESREVRHIYVMGGIRFTLSEQLQLQPSALFKIVKNAPFDMDVNAMLIYLDKYNLGLTYRLGGNQETGLGESIDIVGGLHLGEHLFTGFSYDITLSDIRDYNNGSIEMFLRYCLAKDTDSEIINPRFF